MNLSALLSEELEKLDENGKIKLSNEIFTLLTRYANQGDYYQENLRRADVLGFGGRKTRIAPGAIVRVRDKEKVGQNVFIGLYAYVNGDVTIEDNVLIGPHCSIAAGNHKFDPQTGWFSGRTEPDGDVAADIKNGPEHVTSFIGCIAALCLHRMKTCGKPIALVSMDNCQNNSTRLHWAINEIAYAWKNANLIDDAALAYLTGQITFPLTMIDKITPHPDAQIAARLEKDGLEGMMPFETSKGTIAAPFVNTEKPQYLLIEDNFPLGHPPLEQLGVIFTRADIVSKTARMKACTCLNPNDTTLAVYGCLLGYTKISDEMQDVDLVNLITRMSEIEAMPMVSDPGVLDPHEYLHEALTVRYPNPFMPDTPQRIATDTSEKLATRFGVTLQGYYDSTLPKYRVCKLKYLPLALAGWLRYLLGVDDNGQPFELSPDPNLEMLRQHLKNIHLGVETITEAQLYPILSSKAIFGVNLYEVGAADQITSYFRELTAGKGAVRQTLHKYCGA